jgi:hypothetical protein
MICRPLRSGGAQYACFPAASPPHEKPLEKALAMTSATPHARVFIVPACKQPLRGYVRAVGSGGGRDQRCDKHGPGDTVQLARAGRLCSKRVGQFQIQKGAGFTPRRRRVRGQGLPVAGQEAKRGLARIRTARGSVGRSGESDFAHPGTGAEVDRRKVCEARGGRSKQTYLLTPLPDAAAAVPDRPSGVPRRTRANRKDFSYASRAYALQISP